MIAFFLLLAKRSRNRRQSFKVSLVAIKRQEETVIKLVIIV